MPFWKQVCYNEQSGIIGKIQKSCYEKKMLRQHHAQDLTDL